MLRPKKSASPFRYLVTKTRKKTAALKFAKKASKQDGSPSHHDRRFARTRLRRASLAVNRSRRPAAGRSELENSHLPFRSRVRAMTRRYSDSPPFTPRPNYFCEGCLFIDRQTYKAS